MQAADTISLSLLTVTTTLDLTGCTVVGFSAPAGANITDGTGTFGFLGAAGNLSGTNLASISLTGGTGSAVSLSATGVGNLTVQSATGTATLKDGTGGIQMNGSGGLLTSNVTTITLQGGSGSNVGVSATGTGLLSLRSATGTWTGGDGTGNLQFNGSGAVTWNAVTTWGLLASGNVGLDSTGGVLNLGAGNNSQNINLGTGGTRTISIGSANATVTVNSSGGAASFSLKSATNNAFTLGSNLLVVDTSANVFSTAATIIQGQGTNSATFTQGVKSIAGEALAVGDVVTFANNAGSPNIYKADATYGSGKDLAVGVCVLAAAGGTNPTAVAYGSLVPVTFATAPAAASINKPVYLDTTAGRGTLTAPTGTNTVFILGYLYGANGTDTTVRIMWAPQLVSKTP
jgi:hypothetical protein